MIIDFTQKKDSIDVSYVNENNQISIEEVILEDGYHNYAECDDHDPNKLTDLKSFKGSSIKIEKAKYFTHHNINEFFNQTLKNQKYSMFNRLAIPNPFSFDIETDIDEINGYSDQKNPATGIRSISFTDQNLNSILFVVKNPNHPEFSETDKLYIQNIFQESLKEHYPKHAYETAIRVFDTEAEMLNVFLECMNKHFHLLIGMNCLDYDWQYIYYRCEKLGIDVKKASPTHKLSNKSIDINDHTRIELKIPTHRVIVDYQILFKNSLVYNNLGSYSLDNLAELILDLNKVTYSGNLKTLYDTDYLRFIAYAFIDTILVMLIHKITNLLTVDFFQSFYNNVPYQRLSQNSISEALVYNELRENGMFLLESEKNHNAQRPYAGGYVKAPTKKIVMSVFGLDFKALYPNGMITMGLSPEAKIDEIKTNVFGFPANAEEERKWQKYKAMGYALSPMGRVYDLNYEALYTRIEKKLLAQRGIFQGHMTDIYLIVLPRIEAEIKRRNAIKEMNAL